MDPTISGIPATTTSGPVAVNDDAARQMAVSNWYFIRGRNPLAGVDNSTVMTAAPTNTTSSIGIGPDGTPYVQGSAGTIGNGQADQRYGTSFVLPGGMTIKPTTALLLVLAAYLLLRH